MNNQRKTVIAGIGKYQKSQKSALRRARAPEHRDRQARADRLRPTRRPPPTSPGPGEFQWAQRIFQERQQSIPLACELPALIEERLYELASSIRGLMKA